MGCLATSLLLAIYAVCSWALIALAFGASGALAGFGAIVAAALVGAGLWRIL